MSQVRTTKSSQFCINISSLKWLPTLQYDNIKFNRYYTYLRTLHSRVFNLTWTTVEPNWLSAKNVILREGKKAKKLFRFVFLQKLMETFKGLKLCAFERIQRNPFTGRCKGTQQTYSTQWLIFHKNGT